LRALDAAENRAVVLLRKNPFGTTMKRKMFTATVIRRTISVTAG